MTLFEEYLKEATLLQQIIYNLQDCDWKRCEEIDYLKNYVGYTINKIISDVHEDLKFQFDEKNVAQVEKITDKIWKYGHRTDGVCFLVIYNMIFNNEAKVNEKNEKQLFEVPFFKFKTNKKNGAEIWYIDLEGRVYKSWNDYIENNTLPPCNMVLPKNGEYIPDPEKIDEEENTSVWIEHHKSPSCSNILKHVDIASNILNIGGFGVLIASSFITVAPVVACAGVATAVSTGIYSSIRTINKIVDRSVHEETLADRRTAGDLISISSNLLGFASMGSSRYILNAVSEGRNVSRVIGLGHDICTIGSYMANGIGIGFRYYNMTVDNDFTISSSLQLIGEIIFFTNMVVSSKLSKKLIEDQQTFIINEYKKSLTNKYRRYRFNRSLKKAGSKTEIINKIQAVRTEQELQGIIRNDPTCKTLVKVTDVANSNHIELSEKNFIDNKNVFNDIKIKLPQNFMSTIHTIIKWVPKLCQFVSKEEYKMLTPGDIFSSAIQFLWDWLKYSIQSNVNFNLQQISNIILQNIDEILNNFKVYLKTKFNVPIAQTIAEKFYSKKFNSKKSALEECLSISTAVAMQNDITLTDLRRENLMDVFTDVTKYVESIYIESTVEALSQVSILIIMDQNNERVEKNGENYVKAILFLWSKFKNIREAISTWKTEEILLHLFENSKDKWSQLVLEYQRLSFDCADNETVPQDSSLSVNLCKLRTKQLAEVKGIKISEETIQNNSQLFQDIAIMDRFLEIILEAAFDLVKATVKSNFKCIKEFSKDIIFMQALKWSCEYFKEKVDQVSCNSTISRETLKEDFQKLIENFLKHVDDNFDIKQTQRNMHELEKKL